MIDYEKEMKFAAESPVLVQPDDGGFLVSIDGEPLNFIWQTEAQLRDMARKIAEALGEKH